MIVVNVAGSIVNGLAFSPDGRLLAAACPDGVLKVWEAASLRSGVPLWEEAVFSGFDGNHVQFSPDGKFLFACGDDGGTWVWEVTKGSPGEKMPGPRNDWKQSSVLTCSRDGKYVAWAGGYRGTANSIAVARVGPHKFHKQFAGHDEAIGIMAAAPDGLLSFRRGTRHHRRSVGIMAAAPDGLLSGSADRKIRFWDWSTGKMYHELSLRGFIRTLAVSPGGDHFAGSAGNLIYLWPLEVKEGSRKRLPSKPRTLRGHTREVSCVEFSTDGRTLASSGDDGTLRLWDVASGVERRQFAPGVGPLHWIAFAPDGLTVAVTSDKGHLLVLDLDE